MFHAFGLPPYPSQVPDRLMALHTLFAFFEQMAKAEGPDFGARISTPEALLQLCVPTRAIMASKTVGEALFRVSATFHQHSSHIFFRANRVDGGIEVAETIPISGTALMHHQAQQHIAAFVSCLGMMSNGRPLPAAVRIAPHPTFGVDHLKPYLGDDVTAGPNRQLRMLVPDCALDMAFPWERQSVECGESESLEPVSRNSLAESARILIAGMVADGNPGVDLLAQHANRSRRTLQRLLASEGTSFAALLDGVRKDQALIQINDSGHSVTAIAGHVGYSSVSSLSRAVRRWTSTSPSRLRC